MAIDFTVDWLITNILAFFDVFLLATILFLVIKVGEKYAKKFNFKINYTYLYAAIILYFVYKIFWFFITLYQIQDLFYEYGIIANTALLISAVLMFYEISRLTKIEKRCLSAN